MTKEVQFIVRLFGFNFLNSAGLAEDGPELLLGLALQVFLPALQLLLAPATI